MYDSDLRQGLEFDCNQEASLDRDARLQCISKFYEFIDKQRVMTKRVQSNFDARSGQ